VLAQAVFEAITELNAGAGLLLEADAASHFAVEAGLRGQAQRMDETVRAFRL